MDDKKQSNMDAAKKNKKKLKSRDNGNYGGSSSMNEEEVPSDNREVSQRQGHGFTDDPILISDSDDSSNHSNQSSVQCISDDEEPPNTDAVEQMPQIQLPIISSYGSISGGYMKEFFETHGFPVFKNPLMSVSLISDDEDD
ncbi:uncharacterized protein LOC132935286 isoform X1 [Metopolophium dirhodum]|uniref:uncharacterized protein LOC132935286 isoform X1 n=1 Tax=Metopolophium dirhodum TaxID=44670 RepID=UPI00298FB4AC|nr:uncharacterized protein LOC132935286 isoform X1 [Metopolophium dirhodum]